MASNNILPAQFAGFSSDGPWAACKAGDAAKRTGSPHIENTMLRHAWATYFEIAR
jgi:hypothetical protein